MSKKKRPSATTRPAANDATGDDVAVPPVPAREPCPCGSGRRYKACHGRSAAADATAYVARPFAGLPGECDWVALREVVPAATVEVRLAASGPAAASAGTAVTIATVLPLAWPAMVRKDGAVYVGLQVQGGSGDPSRDAAAALLAALEAEPGSPVAPAPAGAAGDVPLRLQDLLDTSAPFAVRVHEGFDFWLEGTEDRSPDVTASMERANEGVVPTVRLSSVEAAYWCRIRERCHLRWVLPHDEEAVLDGFARLHVAGDDGVGEGSRYVGAFRADGLLVPVWDLAESTTAEALEEPVRALEQRLTEAMADGSPLTPEQRRARAGLLSRSMTLR